MFMPTKGIVFCSAISMVNFKFLWQEFNFSRNVLASLRSAGCNKLRSTFLNLDYPINLINSAINKFSRNIDNIDAAKNTRDDSSTIIVSLPFKDQPSANSVKKKMQVLSANMGVQIKSVFQSFRPRRLAKFSLQSRRSPLLSTMNAWFTNLNVICATQIMSGVLWDLNSP